MPEPKIKIIPVSSPWDTQLFAHLAESPDERFHKAISAPMPRARKLSHEELLELSCHAIELLAPRFNESEFHELMQRLGAGPKFTTKNAAKLLVYLCEKPVLELARAATQKRAAVYHICRRRRRSK